MDGQEANRSKQDLPWAVIVKNLKFHLTDRTQVLLAGVLGNLGLVGLIRGRQRTLLPKSECVWTHMLETKFAFRETGPKRES